MSVFMKGKKTGEPEEKSSDQGENQQQTQPTPGAGIELVGGECSHYCANPAPLDHTLFYSNAAWFSVDFLSFS